MASELARALKALPPDSRHRIKVALAFHQLKNNALARALGSDETLVSRRLNGYRPWTKAERVKVAQLLDVPEVLLFPEVAA